MVRTKQIGKKRKLNGTAKSAPAKESPPPMKSPTQPTELSDADKTKLKNWLDKQEKPFGITTTAISKKRKRSVNSQTQTDLFEDRLSVQYEVKPKTQWECLRRYKKFTVGSESIAVGQCILVKHDESDDQKIDLAAQWKAKVLEVRALDSEHVYIRVAWLNRPEDLDGGRKPHHGKNEVIPTNQMDIIDAMAVNGSVEVFHWDEKDDDAELMNEEQYFWRQTYDYANTKTFSELRKICIDSKPANPDEMILQCGNKDCRKWQHVKCVAEAAVQQAVGEADGTKKDTTKKATPKHINIDKNSSAMAKAESGSFVAEVFIKDLPEGGNRLPSHKSEIFVTNKSDDERRSLNVCCLLCGTEIE